MKIISFMFLLVSIPSFAASNLTNYPKDVRLRIGPYKCPESSESTSILAGKKEAVVPLAGSTWICHFSALWARPYPKEPGDKETIYNYGASVDCVDTKHSGVNAKHSTLDWMVARKSVMILNRSCAGYDLPWSSPTSPRPVTQPSSLSLIGCSDVKKFAKANRCDFVDETDCGYEMSLECLDKKDAADMSKYMPSVK
jgi:hypothetical protein